MDNKSMNGGITPTLYLTLNNESASPTKDRARSLLAPALLLLPIISTCVILAFYPTMIMTDQANNPTPFSLFLLFAFELVLFVSAFALTLYFLSTENLWPRRKNFLVITLALVAFVSVSGLLNQQQHNFLGFPFAWTMPAYVTHCGPNVNATYQYTITQCQSYPSGEQVNSFGVLLDVVYWLSLVEFVLWGSTYVTFTKRRTGRIMMSLTNWLWVIVASCYSASILTYLFSISYLSSQFTYQGFPISPWKYLGLPICTQNPGSWCYGIQTDLLLLDFFFWVGVYLLAIFVLDVVFSSRQGALGMHSI
jgi:hypothetical protein